MAMDSDINKLTAQNIVETVKEVCGYDINFIDLSGYIFASTNAARIGDFHEVGKRVAELGETIEVKSEDSYWGTHMGINAPFFYEGKLTAVIGITGDPEEVRKYLQLALRVTYLIVREHEITSRTFGQRTATNYIIRSLVNGEPLNMAYFNDFCEDRGLDTQAMYRTAVLRTGLRYNPANLAFVEKDVFETFEQIPMTIYRFQYPNEYVCILPSNEQCKAQELLEKIQKKYAGIFRIAIGSEETLFRQKISYDAAVVAASNANAATGVALYDTFDVEILRGSISDSARERYVKKTTSMLTKDEKELLMAYFESNMSLKDTSEKLFIHKNTLQYRLDRIAEKSSYNPRSFRDATVLFLALELEG